MMTDKIHEALSYIDDDMIEAVEKLRETDAQRKKSFKLYDSNFKVIVAAAIICLVVTAAFIIGPAITIFGRYEIALEGSANIATTCGDGNTGNTYAVSGSNVILVKITKIQTDGFVAKIVNDYGQRDIYDDGEPQRGGTKVLDVIYSDEIEFVENIEPAVGIIVKIEYSKVQSGKIMADRVMPEYYDEE